MKNIIAALVLTAVSNIAAADAFAPWETRMVAADTVTVPAMTAPAGFAPWRDRTYVPDMPDATVSIGAMPSAFRPWS